MLTRVVQEHRSAFPGRRIEVGSNGDLGGEWDGDRLAQLASNLIGNAIHYGDEREPIEVTLDGTASDTVSMTVVNAGAIAPDLLPHIFDPFYRGDRQPARGEGLGLGLYIAQQIVVAHHGSIDARSQNASHTIFSVKIPR